MIRLAYDLFASLSTSAKALKKEQPVSTNNKSFNKTEFSIIERSNYNPVNINNDDMHHLTKIESKPIEETVDDIINNPEIKMLKTELENVENLFNNLKAKGENLDVLFRIEKKISELKKSIDQKSYV